MTAIAPGIPKTPVNMAVKGLIPICMLNFPKYRFTILKKIQPVKLFKISLATVLKGAEQTKAVQNIIIAPSTYPVIVTNKLIINPFTNIITKKMINLMLKINK